MDLFFEIFCIFKFFFPHSKSNFVGILIEMFHLGTSDILDHFFLFPSGEDMIYLFVFQFRGFFCDKRIKHSQWDYSGTYS